jgi:hypothetical protein
VRGKGKCGACHHVMRTTLVVWTHQCATLKGVQTDLKCVQTVCRLNVCNLKACRLTCDSPT